MVEVGLGGGEITRQPSASAFDAMRVTCQLARGHIFPTLASLSELPLTGGLLLWCVCVCVCVCVCLCVVALLYRVIAFLAHIISLSTFELSLSHHDRRPSCPLLPLSYLSYLESTWISCPDTD